MVNRGKLDSKQKTGSLKIGEPDFLAVGQLRKPFGLQGEMKLVIFIDSRELFEAGKALYLGKKSIKKVIMSFRESGRNLFIRFVEIDNPEEARKYSNLILYVPSSQLPGLSECNFYYRELMGIRVQDHNGSEIGEITEILETGANDVYVVKDHLSGDEILIPAIKSVVEKIDIESNLMVVNLPEWLD